MPLVPGEGPVGIVLAPSRELARQTFEVVAEFCTALEQCGDARYPSIRAQLLIGGEPGREQVQPFRERGVHCACHSVLFSMASADNLCSVLMTRRFLLSLRCGGHTGTTPGLFEEALHQSGRVSLHLPRRGGQNAGLGF